MSKKQKKVKQSVGEEAGLRRPPRPPGETDSSLKAERIQEMLAAAVESSLGPPAVWQRVRGGAALNRVFGFVDAKSAFTFSQLVSALASVARIPLFVRLADSQVILALQGGETPCLPGVLADDVIISPAAAG